MKIADVIAVAGRAGYFNKDLAAVKAGARGDGFAYEADARPLTPGFRRVVEPGEALSLMLVLEDGQVALGDAMDVIFAAAAGRDPIFRADDQRAVVEGVAGQLVGRDCDAFRALADEIDAMAVDGRRFHTGLRYGLTQALLAAAALARGRTVAEVVADEYGTEIAARPVPILAMCPTDQAKQVDKMILKQAALLPHASFSHAGNDLGPDGVKLLDYAGWLAGRIAALGAAGYRPRIHLDLYGTLGELFADDVEGIAGYLGRLQARLDGFELLIETPVIAADRETQIAAFLDLRNALRAKGLAIGLIADEWCNSLDDIRAFADANAADYLQVKAPDLGGINRTIEALLYCRAKGSGVYLGGSGNETDVSARISAQVALACRADFMLAKPGQGVDEALMILENEMRRTLALVRRRQGG